MHATILVLNTHNMSVSPVTDDEDVLALLNRGRKRCRTEEVDAVIAWMKAASPGDTLRLNRYAVLLATSASSRHGRLEEKATTSYAYTIEPAVMDEEDEEEDEDDIKEDEGFYDKEDDDQY